MLPSIIALGLVALAAFRLSKARVTDPSLERARNSASRVLTVMVIIQSLHFIEELTTGFHLAIGPTFGQPPMPVAVFVVVNVAFIALWLYSIPELRQGTTLAFGASWFLGLAGVMNGFAHPILAWSQGEYFPGLYSSPLVLIAGGILLFKLTKATVARDYSV